MANIILNPVFTGEGRIFINPQGYGGGTKFNYHSSMKIDGLDRSLGDYEPVYLPDPNNYDEFVEVGSIKGAASRVTSTLSGKLPINTYSGLELLADRGCAFNLQVHYGRCTRPDDFATFESAIIIKEARLTSYNLSTLVASNPSERALIDETAGLNAKSFYRVFNQNFLEVTPNLTGRALKVIHADLQGCSELCSAYRDGNKIWIALVDTTLLGLSVTKDGGLTWSQNTASGSITFAATHNDALLAVGGSYLFWSTTNGIDTTDVYATDLADVINVGSGTAIPLFTATTFRVKDYVVTEAYIYVVGCDVDGASGKVYRIDKSTLTLDVIFDDIDGVTSIDALDDNVVIIGTYTGQYWISEVSGFFAYGDEIGPDPITHIKMHDDVHWIATTDSDVYVTNDAGVTWTMTYRIALDGENALVTWYDNLVGYMIYGAHIFRTIDSGTTWKKIYSNGAGDVSLSISISPYNPNLFMAVYNSTPTVSETIKGFV